MVRRHEDILILIARRWRCNFSDCVELVLQNVPVSNVENP